MSIQVVDLFSGPGGLGEGFASFADGRFFQIAVSAEMDPPAHSTLILRSYFRRLRLVGSDLDAYFDFCNGAHPDPWNSRTRSAWNDSMNEARNIELGSSFGNAELDMLLRARLKRDSECVLIGGPPCQAYSLVGRSRNKGKKQYRAEDDHRHFLYREYLRVLQKTRPAVFVMENVKGILSSKVGESRIFHDILLDLVDPDAALTGRKGKENACYRIHSLVAPTRFCREMDVDEIDPRDFVVRAEEYGVPQARHRVILIGIREDIRKTFSPLTPVQPHLTVHDAIGDLPKVRSRLTKKKDSSKEWAKVVTNYMNRLANLAQKKEMAKLATALKRSATQVSSSLEYGSMRLVIDDANKATKSQFAGRLSDSRLKVVLNHDARGHMPKDLRRYAYAAAFAHLHGVSPKGHEQFALHGLAPRHKNWKTGKFQDRFRVQVWEKAATTVTSHISKDGHYFIHPDEPQCRSLTVREAARLQTFPDNYFFQGNRTQQFHQVGNAVPPLLADKIAKAVSKLFSLS